MAFNGSFLWVVANSADRTAYANTDRLKTINGTVYLSFPMHLLAKKGYGVDPNVREEIKVYRDTNTRNLTRVTADGMKTSMTLKFLGGLNNAKKIEADSWFTSHESIAKQRKISLLYYDSDSDTYKTGNFYRANPHYDVISTTATDIIWDAFEYYLAEY